MKLSAQSIQRRGWTAGVLFLAGSRESSLLHSVHTDPGAQRASYTIGTVGSFLGGKAAEA
jgi:hypothetical protein